MKTLRYIFILLILSSCQAQVTDIKDFKVGQFEIGDKVDLNNVTKQGDVPLPHYIDGWTIDNVSTPPVEYFKLPVGYYTLNSDESFVLTLLGDRIINIAKGHYSSSQSDSLIDLFSNKTGKEPVHNSYTQEHPLQPYVTKWNIYTWKTENQIIQVGSSYMRRTSEPDREFDNWTLLFSDLKMEKEIIQRHKEQMFSSNVDSVEYNKLLNAYVNRLNPPENGEYSDYYDSGVIKERGTFKNGQKNGVWIKWFENGQMQDSAYYEKGNLAKTRFMWHPNGQLQLESFWGKPDDRIGKWTRWYSNGQIESITNFNNKGQLHGKHFQYFENGNLKREVTYENEKEIEDKLFDIEGNRIK